MATKDESIEIKYILRIVDSSGKEVVSDPGSDMFSRHGHSDGEDSWGWGNGDFAKRSKLVP